MIYAQPLEAAPIDQGDLIDDCPTAYPAQWDLDVPPYIRLGVELQRVIVLTQTCDLENQKALRVIVGRVFDAQATVDQGILRLADVKGPVRAGRVWGWYFLPKSDEHGLPEMLVDLGQLHTVRLDMLVELCRRGKRKARLQPLYREHLGKHFGDTYSRIGLPQPYPTG